VRWSASQHLAVTVLRHPVSPGEMSLSGAMRTVGLALRVDAQNDSRDQ
jgi:hypothetical protein